MRPHLFALQKFGVDIKTTKGLWQVTRSRLLHAVVVMYESGDTATINAILCAAGIPGKSVIKYASANYQVQEVCFFLQKLGIKIDGVGATTLVVHGKKVIKKNVTYSVSEDPTDAMFFLAAAIVTNSSMQLLLKQSPAAIDKIGEVFYLSQGERHMLLSAGVGEGLFFAGQNHVAIRVISSPDEHALATSKPSEILERQKQAIA